LGVQIGDRLRVESERAGQAGREGIVEEVLSEEPKRLRVRWEDGHESIFVPSAGVVQIEAAPKKRTRAKK
jgi:Domain of unknown function (DUF1918)